MMHHWWFMELYTDLSFQNNGTGWMILDKHTWYQQHIFKWFTVVWSTFSLFCDTTSKMLLSLCKRTTIQIPTCGCFKKNTEFNYRSVFRDYLWCRMRIYWRQSVWGMTGWLSRLSIKWNIWECWTCGFMGPIT